MESVTISHLRSYVDRGWPAISARLSIAGRRSDVSVRASHGPLAGTADPFVHLGLLPAMKLGVELHIEGQVSPRLLRHVEQIQEIISTWYPAFRKVAVRALGSDPAQPAVPPPHVGCFFSGGIDSSYTVLKHCSEVTHLVFVRGFDVRLSDQTLWDVVAPPIRRAADTLGKQLIEVETDARSVLDPYADWGEVSNGAVLAGVGLALAPQMSRVYIAGAVSYRMLHPLGSHALLDPLWSTEQLEIVHDGGEGDRWWKLDRLVSSHTALQWLRVCYTNTGLSYNCGRCRKCLSVKCYLKAAGVLHECPTFDDEIDLDLVAHMKIEGLPILSMRASLLPAIERFGTQPEIANALRASIEASELGRKFGLDPLSLPDQAQRVSELEAQVRLSEERAARLAARLQTMQTSRSWRLTAPLRAVGQWTGTIQQSLARRG